MQLHCCSCNLPLKGRATLNRPIPRIHCQVSSATSSFCKRCNDKCKGKAPAENRHSNRCSACRICEACQT